jgi:twitching motility two-component system response regulator PilH
MEQIEMASKKIMVVDDSPTERAFMERMLKKGGYEVVIVASGEAAVERSAVDLPDLILMDVVMPGLNGFQATRLITHEARTRHIPIVICSTKDAETDVIWGLRQGAKDYLVKPVNERELLDKIRLLVLDGPATAAIH